MTSPGTGSSFVVIEDIIFNDTLTNMTLTLQNQSSNFIVDSGFWVWYVAYFVPIFICLLIIMITVYAPKKAVAAREVSTVESYKDDEDCYHSDSERMVDKGHTDRLYGGSVRPQSHINANYSAGNFSASLGDDLVDGDCVGGPRGMTLGRSNQHNNRLLNITPNPQGLYAFPLLARDPSSPGTSDREEQHNAYWLTGY